MHPSDVSIDPLLDCLSLYERRFVVAYLDEHGGEAPLADVEHALLERTAAEEEAHDVALQQVANALHDRHLPRLEDNGIVRVSGDTVELRDQLAAAIVDQFENGDWNDHATATESWRSESEKPTVTREKYTFDQDRTLSDAILDAIERHRDAELSRDDFELFEDVSFEAMNELFRTDASATTRLSLTARSVVLELWGDDGIQIRVADAATA